MVKGESTSQTYLRQGTCQRCGSAIKAGCKYCMLCRVEAPKEQTRLRRESRHRHLLTRLCKNCGNPIGTLDPRQTVCSKQCGYEIRTLERVSSQCIVCGETVERYRSQAEKHKGVCCSLECQRKHALEINRGPGGFPETDWIRRSLKAKARWHRHRSRNRRNANKWFCQIARRMQRKYAVLDKDTWEYKIGLRLNAGRGRKSKRKIGDPIPSGSISSAIRKIDQRRKYFEMDDWSKKIGNKLSSMSGRRRRKHESRIKSGGDKEQVKSGWIQMCFDWVGH